MTQILMYCCFYNNNNNNNEPRKESSHGIMDYADSQFQQDHSIEQEVF
jgi:hypothetical protein